MWRLARLAEKLTELLKSGGDPEKIKILTRELRYGSPWELGEPLKDVTIDMQIYTLYEGSGYGYSRTIKRTTIHTLNKIRQDMEREKMKNLAGDQGIDHVEVHTENLLWIPGEHGSWIPGEGSDPTA